MGDSIDVGFLEMKEGTIDLKFEKVFSSDSQAIQTDWANHSPNRRSLPKPRQTD